MFPPKKSKYGNKKVTYAGQIFDSIGERDRYFYLQEAERQGRIKDLKCQVRFPLDVNGLKVCAYIADFVYFLPDGHRIVEDYKGAITDVFRLKAKLFKAIYGMEVKISGRKICPLTICETERRK